MLSFHVKNGKLKATSQPLPKLRPGWALVRVRLAGICNTDVEILRGYRGFFGTPGHEFVGEVTEMHGVSAAAKEKWLGQRVCGEINVSCCAYGFKPVCDFCRRGLKTHCARRTVLGIVNHDGAFAEYLALPIENLHVVPKNVTDEQAVFVEPLAAACEILDQVNVKKFRCAAVLGDGKLAQLIARVLRTAIPRVVMYGKHEEKLALARRAGIQTRKVRGDASDLKRIKENFRLVVEATAHCRTAGDPGAQVHVSRRGTGRNVADRRERNYNRRFALRPIRESDCSPTLRQDRSSAAYHPDISSRRGAKSHFLRTTSCRDESPAEDVRKKPDYSLLMQEATQAAPKPLSILTTVTLEAQELSMPRSAATPPKLAP